MILGKMHHSQDLRVSSLLTIGSINCRLPQTPRSPSTAAAHYFDDTFLRQRRASLGGRRPSTLQRSNTRRRSIGNRSDFSDKTNGETGEMEEEEENGDVHSNGDPSRSWTIYKEDDPKSGHPAYEDPDDPINKYVREQLQRIKSSESLEFAEELTASVDGAGDES